MKNISYSVEDIKDLTSSGWLIAMIKFAEDIDFFAPFMDINVNIKQVKYSTVNKFQTLVASVLIFEIYQFQVVFREWPQPSYVG